MKINTQLLDKISMSYVILPLIIFFFGWLNTTTLLIALTSLFLIIKFIFKNIKKTELEIDNKLILMTIILCALWSYFSGIGGFIHQSTDWHMRNAIFRDLINYSYPVIYDNGSALVYYFSTFLPSTIIGKISLFLGSTEQQSFFIANIFNFLYCTLGLILITLEIYVYTKAKKNSKIWILFIFILFSGMDILLVPSKYMIEFLHIDRHYHLQYSSNSTLLFWVYNQAIIPWLITILFLRNYKRVENFGFYGTLLFFNSPLPFVGLAIYLGIIGITDFIKRINTKHLTKYLKKIFSIQNILSIFIVLPITYLFYSSNETAGADKLNFIYHKGTLIFCLMFIFLEAGAYLLLIKDKFKNNIIYIITLLSLISFPFLQIGTQPDLCMRASICGLFTLMLLVIKFLNDKNIEKSRKCFIIICLCIGAVTPYYEIYRGIYYTFVNPQIIVKDEIQTLNNKIKKGNVMKILTMNDIIPNYGNYNNYGTLNPKEEIFFKYLSKINKIKTTK